MPATFTPAGEAAHRPVPHGPRVWRAGGGVPQGALQVPPRPCRHRSIRVPEHVHVLPVGCQYGCWAGWPAIRMPAAVGRQSQHWSSGRHAPQSCLVACLARCSRPNRPSPAPLQHVAQAPGGRQERQGDWRRRAAAGGAHAALRVGGRRLGGRGGRRGRRARPRACPPGLWLGEAGGAGASSAACSKASAARALLKPVAARGSRLQAEQAPGAAGTGHALPQPPLLSSPAPGPTPTHPTPTFPPTPAPLRRPAAVLPRHGAGAHLLGAHPGQHEGLHRHAQAQQLPEPAHHGAPLPPALAPCPCVKPVWPVLQGRAARPRPSSCQHPCCGACAPGLRFGPRPGTFCLARPAPDPGAPAHSHPGKFCVPACRWSPPAWMWLPPWTMGPGRRAGPRAARPWCKCSSP